MLKKNAMRWVKALRSGKYKQGDQFLMRGDEDSVHRFCCLGVLAAINGVEVEPDDRQALDNGLHVDCDLATEAGRIYKLDEYNNRFPIKLKVGGKLWSYQSLADANDSGASFKVIATWIEKNYRLI
jgi:hypothetical protein